MSLDRVSERGREVLEEFAERSNGASELKLDGFHIEADPVWKAAEVKLSMRELRAQRKKLGLCMSCGGQREDRKFANCAACRAKRAAAKAAERSK